MDRERCRLYQCTWCNKKFETYVTPADVGYVVCPRSCHKGKVVDITEKEEEKIRSHREKVAARLEELEKQQQED